MIIKVLFVLEKIAQINSQVFLISECLKLAIKMRSYLSIEHPEKNRELAQKLFNINKSINEATKDGNLKEIEKIISGIGMPVPSPMHNLPES